MFLFLFYFFMFRADTRLFLFNLIFENLTLHIFLIIIIIIRCSGMFRNVARFLVLSLNLSLKSNYTMILVQFGINKQL